MDALAQHAARRPDAPAVVDGDRTFTWRAYHEARNRLARGLRRLGLDAGDHVVVHAANSAEYLLAGAAARALGAVPVAMNHRLTADEAAHVLDAKVADEISRRATDLVAGFPLYPEIDLG